MIVIENVKMIRMFIVMLVEALGLGEESVRKFRRAIALWSEFTKDANFKSFNGKIALQFKRWLKNRKYRGKQVSPGTINSVLYQLKRFFQWLSMQPGYKSKIKLSDLEYLNLSRKERKMLGDTSRVKYPTLEQVTQICMNREIKTIIDEMWQALIAWLICSGMRISAIASLAIGCFDPDTLCVDQDPKRGVKTKYSKHIITYLFNFDADLIEIIRNWHKRLIDLGYGYGQPLFPAAELNRTDGMSFAKPVELSCNFLTSNRLREIIKQCTIEAGVEYFHPHAFRHATIALARKNAKNIEQLKAISQCLGHELISTTFSIYGNLSPEQVHENIAKINHSFTEGKSNHNDNDYVNFLKFKQFMNENGE